MQVVCDVALIWASAVLGDIAVQRPQPTTTISLPCFSKGVWPFWDTFSSLTTPLKKNRRGGRGGSHLAKRMLYLLKSDRWEFGSGHISLSLVFSLKLMLLHRAFFAFSKTPVSRDIFTWQSQHLVKIFLDLHPAAKKSEKGSGCTLGSPGK